jgi:hypothetical protein
MEWISIKEVCNLTNKSESTVRNLARKLKDSNSKNIRLERLKTGHDKILFKLSFVNRELLTVKPVGNKNTSVDSGLLKTVEILERQLVAKDELINNLTQLLAMEKQHVQKLLDAPETKKKKRWFWSRKD